MSALNEYYAALERLKPISQQFFPKALQLIMTLLHWKQDVNGALLKRAVTLH